MSLQLQLQLEKPTNVSDDTFPLDKGKGVDRSGSQPDHEDSGFPTFSPKGSPRREQPLGEDRLDEPVEEPKEIVPDEHHKIWSLYVKGVKYLLVVPVEFKLNELHEVDGYDAKYDVLNLKSAVLAIPQIVPKDYAVHDFGLNDFGIVAYKPLYVKSLPRSILDFILSPFKILKRLLVWAWSKIKNMFRVPDFANLYYPVRNQLDFLVPSRTNSDVIRDLKLAEHDERPAVSVRLTAREAVNLEEEFRNNSDVKVYISDAFVDRLSCFAPVSNWLAKPKGLPRLLGDMFESAGYFMSIGVPLTALGGAVISIAVAFLGGIGVPAMLYAWFIGMVASIPVTGVFGFLLKALDKLWNNL